MCLSVSVLGTPMSPAETAESIEMPFEGQTRLRNRVLDVVHIDASWRIQLNDLVRWCKEYLCSE